MRYNTPEEAFNKEQIALMQELEFTPIYQEQTKEFMCYRKHYGPIGGSYLFVYPELQRGYNSQIVMDRNVFLQGHKECYEDYQKLKSSGLFL
jgi:cystathionine beta-lyase family protein involved in aluminum resistance